MCNIKMGSLKRTVSTLFTMKQGTCIIFLPSETGRWDRKLCKGSTAKDTRPECNHDIPGEWVMNGHGLVRISLEERIPSLS